MPIITAHKLAMIKRNIEIANLYKNQNMEISELSEKFNLSETTISGILTKHKLKRRKKPIKKTK